MIPSYPAKIIAVGINDPKIPMIIPSARNGALINPFAAPISFIIEISSSLTATPIDTVLLTRKIETAIKIRMIPPARYVPIVLIFVIPSAAPSE